MLIGLTKKVKIWVVSLSTISLVVLLTFQNCGKAGFEASNGTVKLSSAVSAEAAKAPFAFESTFDSISYMSCAGNGASGPGFFTISAGAFSSGGMRVSDSFINYAKANSRKASPEIEDVKRFLSETPANVGAIPQIAVRPKGDLQKIIPATGSNPSYGIDFFNITGDPTDDRWLDLLVRNRSFTNYFPVAPIGGKRFESSINYKTSEQFAYDLREYMNNGINGDPNRRGILTLTHAVSATSFAARAPASDPAKAYGRGYQLRFDRFPNATYYAFGSTNLLVEVLEANLENPTVATGTWKCDLQLMVVRPKDRIAVCPTSQALVNVDLSTLSRVGGHLKPEFWDVNLQYGCVVPKSGDCYPTENGQVTEVEYDLSQPCFQNVTEIQSNYQGQPPKKLCPQFVSFCRRL